MWVAPLPKSNWDSEGPKLLHFVNKKTPPFCKGPGKEPLKIQEPLKIP